MHPFFISDPDSDSPYCVALRQAVTAHQGALVVFEEHCVLPRCAAQMRQWRAHENYFIITEDGAGALRYNDWGTIAQFLKDRCSKVVVGGGFFDGTLERGGGCAWSVANRVRDAGLELELRPQLLLRSDGRRAHLAQGSWNPRPL